MAKSKSSKETPLMQQHSAIKAKYPDAILLFRVGDFYETFGQDAVIASKVLGITLTRRSKEQTDSSELAGFPHHALDNYLHKLVKAGYRVAICDQLEDPKQAKGIVKRGVTELVTPGVALNDNLLNHANNNYLAAIHQNKDQYSIALVDVSTGDCFVAEGAQDYIDKLIQGFMPSEILVCKPLLKEYQTWLGQQYYLFPLEDWLFKSEYTRPLLLNHFKTHSLKGFGIDDMELAEVAAGILIHYLKETQHEQLGHIKPIQRITNGEFLWMDRFTIKNLELLPQGYDGRSSLLEVLDNTLSPMGARLLKRWLVFPLFDLAKIKQRHDIIAAFHKDNTLLDELRQTLKQIGDIERLISRIPLRKSNPREIKQLARSLQTVEQVQKCLRNHAAFETLANSIMDHQYLVERIDHTIIDNPAGNTVRPGFIADGVNEELDKLRHVSRDGKNVLLDIQQRESQNTGIPSLKVAYNNVFGYYLEVTNTHKDKVPEHWIRKQTLTNAERYITPELKTYEDLILGAEEKILKIEQDLFLQLLIDIEPHIQHIQATAYTIAQIDVLSTFAYNALKYNYVQPQMHEQSYLKLTAARHPVIERQLDQQDVYIPNDIELNKADQQIIILTGPNMSGKSALLRQVALNVLMAHIGSYVPSAAAEIPLTDKIFTRVGASDNLSAGESTFMVEMNETAGIINNLSDKSLIILDEIGRGTSTYDGISIAWSIVEYLAKSTHQPLSLFATHYHELNEIEHQMPTVQNWHITYKQTAHNVLFLRKLARGGSLHSFGIQVAKMSGMPKQIIERAEEILAVLEGKEKDRHLQNIKSIPTQQYQLNIFDSMSDDLRSIQKLLQATDINTLTPVEALLKLNELKSIVSQYES